MRSARRSCSCGDAAQITFALQLVQLTGHRATIQLHRAGQFRRRYRTQLLRLLEDQVLGKTEVQALAGELGFDRTHHFGTHHGQGGTNSARRLGAWDSLACRMGPDEGVGRSASSPAFYCRKYICQGKYMPVYVCCSKKTGRVCWKSAPWPSSSCRPASSAWPDRAIRTARRHPGARSAGNCASSRGSIARRTDSGVAGSSIWWAQATKVSSGDVAGLDFMESSLVVDIGSSWVRGS